MSGWWTARSAQFRLRREVRESNISTVLIIKGVRESTLSVGKSRARNPTQNPTQKPTPNRPEPGRTIQRLRTAPCPQALRSARDAWRMARTVLIKVKIKKKKPTQLSTLNHSHAVAAPQRDSSTHHTPLHHSKVHPPHAAGWRTKSKMTQ